MLRDASLGLSIFMAQSSNAIKCIQTGQDLILPVFIFIEGQSLFAQSTQLHAKKSHHVIPTSPIKDDMKKNPTTFNS